MLPGPVAEGSAETLAQLIERHQVTITDFVPSVFNALVPQMVAAAPLRQQLRSLRAIIVGGEEITPATTYQFMAAFPDVRVINLYGPTEASIGCICYEVTGSEGDAIPIGRPIANMRVLVLDPDRNPVPMGVRRGAVPGRDLRRRWAISTTRRRPRTSFVDSRCPELGARHGSTGPAIGCATARTASSSSSGRLDQQVKLRGFRIELGEIETALGQHPAVHEAWCSLREDTPGDKRLVAYVVPRGDRSRGRELRGFLGRTLPEYMVPTAFVPLAELPRSPGGKVYRRALPAPDYTGPALADVGEAPRTPTEASIAGIWSRGARAGAGRRPRQLLRAGRPLPARHPGGRPNTQRIGSGRAAASTLRVAHGGRPHRADRDRASVARGGGRR